MEHSIRKSVTAGWRSEGVAHMGLLSANSIYENQSYGKVRTQNTVEDNVMILRAGRIQEDEINVARYKHGDIVNECNILVSKLERKRSHERSSSR